MAVDHLHRLSNLQVPDQDLLQSGICRWSSYRAELLKLKTYLCFEFGLC